MKKFRNILFYVGIIGSFSSIMYWIVLQGEKLEKGRNIINPLSVKGPWQEFIDSISSSLANPVGVLLLQIITIIIITRMFGWVCKKIGQPTVIGEIIAGIALGPSLLGMLLPGVSAVLFPPHSIGNLQILSQIGLILFMFVIGMELDLKVLRSKAHDAIVISHASIIVPFALGMGLAYFIYMHFALKGVPFASFGLFLSIAMSITAFPVLARIVQERGIHKTKLGSVIITCAAADDITAWCLLAVVIAIVKAGSFVSSLYTIFLVVAYVFIMLKVVRPFLKRIGDLFSQKSLNKSMIAILFLTLLVSAYVTESIGIHALFGAFMAGVIMPVNEKLRSVVIEKIEDVSLVLLLPLYFVFTGLRTEIGLLNDPYLWKVTGLIVFVAVLGKFVGSSLAAKFVKQSWKDSLIIGALMNTRGLMELIILNIGYDLGVLPPEIFTMMVIMALVTTFMTGPALKLIEVLFKSKDINFQKTISNISKNKILIFFSDMENGPALLRLANCFSQKNNKNTVITAMHLIPTNGLHHRNLELYEKESFAPITVEAQSLKLTITSLFKVSNDLETEVAEMGNKGDYDLLLLNLEQSIFEGSLLGRILGFTTKIINPERMINTVTGKEKLFESSLFDEKIYSILSKSKIPVGILINKNFQSVERVFVPFVESSDTFLITYIQKLIHNSNAQVTILDVKGNLNKNVEMKEMIRTIGQNAPNHINSVDMKMMDEKLLYSYDLALVSLSGWERLLEMRLEWVSRISSTLIIENIY